MSIHGEKKTLNILLISYDWRNLYEENFEEIIEKLERDGINPTQNKFFSINWSVKSYSKKISDNFDTVHLKAHIGRLRVLYDLANIFIVPFLLKKHAFKPDIILLYDFPSVFGSLYPRLFLESKAIVALTNLPRNLIATRKYHQGALIYQKFAEFFGKYIAHYILTISETTMSYAKKIGFSTTKIKMFNPNTIVRDQKYIEVSQKGDVRKKYNISKDKKIILSVGRLENEKNFEGLIDAFQKVNDKNLVMIIIGQGSLEAQLKKMVSELSLGNSVFFGGNIDRQSIWNFYRDADLFILLSNSEGLGLAFWEAMFMNVPVIGSRVGGIIETIGSSGERGFFWEEKDGIEDLKNKIRLCIEKPEEIRKIMACARDYVEKKISVKTSINDLINQTN